MDEERVTTTEPAANHTTVIERRGGSSIGGILIGLAVLIAVLVGAWYAVQASQSRSSRDSAVEDAAASVGHAAEKVGDAATGATK